MSNWFSKQTVDPELAADLAAGETVNQHALAHAETSAAAAGAGEHESGISTADHENPTTSETPTPTSDPDAVQAAETVTSEATAKPEWPHAKYVKPVKYPTGENGKAYKARIKAAQTAYDAALAAWGAGDHETYEAAYATYVSLTSTASTDDTSTADADATAHAAAMVTANNAVAGDTGAAEKPAPDAPDQGTGDSTGAATPALPSLDASMAALTAMKNAIDAADGAPAVSDTSNPELIAGYDMSKWPHWLDPIKPDADAIHAANAVCVGLKKVTGPTANVLSVAVYLNMARHGVPPVNPYDVAWGIHAVMVGGRKQVVDHKVVAAQQLVHNKRAVNWQPIGVPSIRVGNGDIKPKQTQRLRLTTAGVLLVRKHFASLGNRDVPLWLADADAAYKAAEAAALAAMQAKPNTTA